MTIQAPPRPPATARKRTGRPGGGPPPGFQPSKVFWILLALPGMLWLVVLFVVPFYAVLAIGEGKLRSGSAT
jgi:hypothetical protein